MFFSKCFKTDVSTTGLPFPLDIILFNEESHMVISMLIQFLGLDTYRFVPELLLSFIFKMSMSVESQSSQFPHLKYDELLDENIHS